jgi:hypothetical protein
MIQLNDALKAKLTEKHQALRFAESQMDEFLTVVLEANSINLKEIEKVEYNTKEGTITFNKIENVG